MKKAVIKIDGVKVGDVVVAAMVALAAVLMLAMSLSRGSGGYARIVTPQNEYTVDLSEDGEYMLQGGGYTLTAVCGGGEIYVSHSDCPDGICAAHRPISRRGEVIACVPAEIVIKIVSGEGESDVGYDAVVG